MRCGALAGFATDFVGISSQQTIGAASARLCSADSTEMCDDLPFKPQFGPAGSRKLLALVTRDGLAVDQIEIGSHTAPTLRQPAPVKRVRLVRVGHSVIVARHKHRIEGHYPAVAETGDGEA